MYEIQREIRELETLRGRARVGYGMLALGLLAAVLMAFLSDVAWAAGVGLFAVCLYLLICRRDVRKYRKRYRDVKLINEMQGILSDCVIVDHGLIPLEQVRQDGALPGDIAHGVSRVGIRGELDRGIMGELADVAFPVSAGQAGKGPKHVILSGCYMRFALKKDSGLHAVGFRKGHLLESALCAYYQSLGMIPQPGQKLWIFAEPDGVLPGYGLLTALQNLDEHTDGEAIVFVDRDRVFVMLRGRFLDIGEPDYKHPVTMDALRRRYLPELSDIKKILFQCMEETE